MPLTATHEEIKAYQKKVEKGKITPDGLGLCPRCNLEPEHFKIHAFRERRFLIIEELLLKAIYCTLVRSNVSAVARHSPFIRIFRFPTNTIPGKRF